MTEVQRLKTELEAARQEYKQAEEVREANLALSNVTTLEAEYKKALSEEKNDQPVDGEQREADAIAGEVRMSNYLQAALDNRPADGAEREHNAVLGMSNTAFPLSVLAPTEVRATTNAESQISPSGWLDRLFAGTQAMRLGVTLQSVAPGVASYPLTASGPSPTGRAREQAIGEGAWTVSVVEAKPRRVSLRLSFTAEDAARLPMLEQSLQRDMQAALHRAR